MHLMTSLHVVLQWFLSPYFVVLWCLAVVVVACRHVSKLWAMYRQAREALQALLYVVQQDDLDSLEDVVASHPILALGWRSYSSALCEPNDKQIVSLRSSAQSFSAETTYDAVLSSKTREANATMLSSLGILGTFLGLSAGVWIAQTYFDGDSQHIQYGLSQLLSGAGLAFMTSLVGLVCSLVYTRCERGVVEDLDHILHHVCATLDTRFPLQLWEHMLMGQVSLAEDHHKTLIDIAEELRKSRRQDMVWHANCLKDLVQTFQKELHSSTHIHLEQMSVALEENVQELSGMAEQLHTFGDRFGSYLEQHHSDLQKGLEDVRQNVLHPLNQFSQQLSEDVNKVVSNLSHEISMEPLSRQCESMEVAIQSFTHALQLLSGDLHLMRAEHLKPKEATDVFEGAPLQTEQKRRFRVQRFPGSHGART